MIWTYSNGEWHKRPVHITQAEKRAAFLCCPGPSLMGINPNAFMRPGIFTAAINSAYPRVYHPDIWIGGDTPECHHPHLMHTSFPKYFHGGLSGHPSQIHKQFNTHFVDSDQKPFMSNDDPDKVSFPRSTFLFALELLVKMGFLRIYLVGCDLSHARGDYWHSDELSHECRIANEKVHQYIMDTLRSKIAELEKRGVTIFSTSAESPINNHLVKFVPIYQAINREEKLIDCKDFRFRHVLEIQGGKNWPQQVVGFTEE